MLRNYFKIATRNFINQKYYSLINTVGLALGTASCLLILLFVWDELSYEKDFKHHEHIYRLVEDFPMGTHLSQSATVPFPTKANLMAEFTEVTNATLIYRPGSWGNTPIIKVDDAEYYEDNFIFAEHEFIEIYDFKFISGDSKTALKGPHEILLTESTAKKYFGNNDPIGKTLRLNNFRDLEVIGVIGDLPVNTHLSFELIASFETFKTFFNNPAFFETQWTWVAAWMYFTVDSETDANKITNGLDAFVKAHYPTNLTDAGVKLRLQKVNDVHLTSNLELEFEQNGNIRNVYLFTFIAILILMIAVINFVNLATSRSIKRAKEVGLRKSMGAHKQMIMFQFMGEAILTSLLSLLLSIAIIYLALPWFNQLTGKDIKFDLLNNLPLLGGTISLAIIVGLLAGCYPAIVLSSYQPTEVLKGKSGNVGSSFLRKGLVVSQFIISISLIICIGIVNNQLQYIHNKDLGFDKDQVLMVDFGFNLFNRFEGLKSELLKNNEVQAVSLLAEVFLAKVKLLKMHSFRVGRPMMSSNGLVLCSRGMILKKCLMLSSLKGIVFKSAARLIRSDT